MKTAAIKLAIPISKKITKKCTADGNVFDTLKSFNICEPIDSDGKWGFWFVWHCKYPAVLALILWSQNHVTEKKSLANKKNLIACPPIK